MVKKLNLLTPINRLSYGRVGLNILVELTKLGVEVSLFPIPGQQYIDCEPEYVKYVEHGLSNAKYYDCNANALRIWHQFDLAQFVGRGSHIGFPIFELDTFKEEEKHQLQSCDKLFVCSNWAANVVRDNLVCNQPETLVVPLGYDPKIFYPEESRRTKLVFLNVGKWEKRKGHDFLADVFLETLEGKNAELWMIPGNAPTNHQPDFVRKYNHPQIKIFPLLRTQQDVANTMRQAHVGIFPSRAEGWCLLPDTEIITNRGLQKINHVLEGDLVIDYEGCVNSVTQLLSREYNGEILDIHVVGSESISITPNHTVLAYQNPYKEFKTLKKNIYNGKIQPKWVEADKLTENDYLVTPKMKYADDEFVRGNIKFVPTEDMMRLFGYYIAEGSTNNNGSIRFSFNANEEKYHEDVKYIIDKEFVCKPSIEVLDRNRTNIIFNNIGFSDMFKALFGESARTKLIPFEFFFMSNDLIKNLLVGLFRGDGTCWNQKFSLSTTSKTLAYQVKFLLIKLGLKPSLQTMGNRTEYRVTISGKDRHLFNYDDIDIVDKKENSQFIYHDNLIIPIKNIVRKPYNGTVYNLSTDGTHTYCTNSFVVHNCLPALEMMGCGKPILYFNYSGITEFALGPEVITPTELEPAEDNVWFHGQGNWAKITSEETNRLKDAITTLYAQFENDKRVITNDNKNKVLESAKKFTWANTARKIMETIC